MFMEGLENADGLLKNSGFQVRPNGVRFANIHFAAEQGFETFFEIEKLEQTGRAGKLDQDANALSGAGFAAGNRTKKGEIGNLVAFHQFFLLFAKNADYIITFHELPFFAFCLSELADGFRTLVGNSSHHKGNVLMSVNYQAGIGQGLKPTVCHRSTDDQTRRPGGTLKASRGYQ